MNHWKRITEKYISQESLQENNFICQEVETKMYLSSLDKKEKNKNNNIYINERHTNGEFISIDSNKKYQRKSNKSDYVNPKRERKIPVKGNKKYQTKPKKTTLYLRRNIQDKCKL
jgi:hypothetical protein